MVLVQPVVITIAILVMGVLHVVHALISRHPIQYTLEEVIVPLLAHGIVLLDIIQMCLVHVINAI